MSTTNTFKLTFATDEGRSLTIAIPRADILAPHQAVLDAMDTIINSRTVVTTAGRPTDRESAKIVVVSDNDIDLNFQ